LKEVKKEGDTDDYNEINPAHYEAFMRKVFEEAYRVMSDHSWMICWFGPDPWFEPMAQWIEEAGMPSQPEGLSWEDHRKNWLKSKKGFKIRRLPGVWVKPNGQTMQPSKYLAHCTEFFYYARKGDPSIVRQGMNNSFQYSPVPAKKKIHPTERPIEMIQDLLKTFGRPGNTVMVPFAGSGNTLLAATNSEMVPFGWDLAQAYKDAFSIRVSTETFKQWRSY
jgi:DNA modification methylase